jgi:cysteine-rich repeat protein
MSVFVLVCSILALIPIFSDLLFVLVSQVAICGDGLVVGPEQCDDGVRPPVSGDGCSDTCQNETAFYCTYDSIANKSVCSRMIFFRFRVLVSLLFLILSLFFS